MVCFHFDVGTTENERSIVEKTAAGNGQFDISKPAACQEGRTTSRWIGSKWTPRQEKQGRSNKGKLGRPCLLGADIYKPSGF